MKKEEQMVVRRNSISQSSRRRTSLAVGLMVINLTISAAACGQTNQPWLAPDSAKSAKNPVRVSPEGLVAAERMYEINCASCHGEEATGKGEAANMLPRNPANLKDTQMMGKMTDGELYWKIGTGRAPMPSYQKKLSEPERWELVNYLRQLVGRGEYKYRGLIEPR